MTHEIILFEEEATYEENKSRLLKKHEGKSVLIKSRKVIGSFESEKDAICRGFGEFGNASFFCEKDRKRRTVEDFPLRFNKRKIQRKIECG